MVLEACKGKDEKDSSTLEEYIENIGKTFFEAGLIPEIQKTVRDQGHKKLENSINAAIIAESKLIKRCAVCSKCNNPGHYANKCKSIFRHVEPVQSSTRYYYEPSRYIKNDVWKEQDFTQE